jgi:hypothetical protein
MNAPYISQVDLHHLMAPTAGLRPNQSLKGKRVDLVLMHIVQSAAHDNFCIWDF